MRVLMLDGDGMLGHPLTGFLLHESVEYQARS
jgi:hypothetical protein